MIGFGSPHTPEPVVPSPGVSFLDLGSVVVSARCKVLGWSLRMRD